MQHHIGHHALLADGRTAALVDPEGNLAWLCWPRIDSPPCLLALLDDARGGCFALRPADPDARVVSRRYHDGTLVLETVWDSATGQVAIDDALAWEGAPALLRRVRPLRGRCTLTARARIAFDAARARAQPELAGGRAVLRGGGLELALHVPTQWIADGETLVASLDACAGEAPLRVTLGDAAAAPPPDAVDATLRAWRRLAGTHTPRPSDLAAAAMDEGEWLRCVRTSVAVLLGLLQRGGGIVAAPTTSLPQWPGSSRTWDYRYCWLRDASLAAIALARSGHWHAARAIGDFLGGAISNTGPMPLWRVDGTAPPAETVLAHLSGYRGAQPVRIGNAAAYQVQVDAPAELIELAWTLATHDALPQALAAASAVCANWLLTHASEPDHGIWEIRGTPRLYTHSRVMASAALRGAAALAARGLVHGDGGAWLAASDALRRDLLQGGAGPLQLHDHGGGADAALTLLAHVGFLDAHDPRTVRTLQHIEERLDRDGLLDRYEGQPDGIDAPCAPFVFPTFWMAEAMQATRGAGRRYFEAALASRGPLGLFGEVVDVTARAPLGNYPQAQSHAAFLNAAVS